MSNLPDIKTITDLLKKGLTLEAQEQIMALREAAVDLKAENTELKEQLAEMKKKNDIQDKIVWEKPYYFLLNGDKKDGPYCQLCWDKEQQLIRLQGGGKNAWHCQCCNNKVADKNYVHPQPPQRRVSIVSLGT